MAKFRKKPVVIEAVLYQGYGAGSAWFKSVDVTPWLEQAYEDDVLANTQAEDGVHLTIKTLEGKMRAAPGDWIIKGVKGEIYACKPDIFEATYEPVEG